MTRTLVTGATGFLGGAVVSALRTGGVDVIPVGRDPVKCAERGCVSVDLASLIAQWPDLGQIDQIVHCAALSAPFGRHADFVAANITATQHLVDFAEMNGIKRFVQISTSSVHFAFKDQLNVRENAPFPPPVNAYAATKRAAEDSVLAVPAINPIVLRPRGIYGVGDTALLPRLLKVAAKRPLPIFRDGVAKIDLTHVDDVVAAVVKACESPTVTGAFNISSGEVLQVQSIVNQASAKAGITVAWRKQPLALAMAVGGLLEGIARIDPRNREPLITRYALGLFAFEQSLDLTKSRELLGWTPQVTFAEGLERTFAL
jgi:nucleoside-diphosphate-sugar epimerase